MLTFALCCALVTYMGYMASLAALQSATPNVGGHLVHGLVVQGSFSCPALCVPQMQMAIRKSRAWLLASL
jgi:hypothetical protein